MPAGKATVCNEAAGGSSAWANWVLKRWIVMRSAGAARSDWAEGTAGPGVQAASAAARIRKIAAER